MPTWRISTWPVLRTRASVTRQPADVQVICLNHSERHPGLSLIDVESLAKISRRNYKAQLGNSVEKKACIGSPLVWP